MMASRGMVKCISDMDELGKQKNELQNIIKEAFDLLATKEDRIISAAIKKKCDEKYGPTWHCIVGEDFHAAVSQDTKTYMFAVVGSKSVMVYKCG